MTQLEVATATKMFIEGEISVNIEDVE